MPDDAWSRKVRGHPWYGGETISVGIGQGPILVTPIQLAVAYAALVNGGFLVQPHLVAGHGRSAAPDRPPCRGSRRPCGRAMELVVAGSRGTARRLAPCPCASPARPGPRR